MFQETSVKILIVFLLRNELIPIFYTNMYKAKHDSNGSIRKID